jgi:hypothetical protein
VGEKKPVREGRRRPHTREEKCCRDREVYRRRHLHVAATEASSGAPRAWRSAEGARREEGEREVGRPRWVGGWVGVLK